MDISADCQRMTGKIHETATPKRKTECSETNDSEGDEDEKTCSAVPRIFWIIVKPESIP